MPSSTSQAWSTDIGLRMRQFALLKFVGVSFFTWLFFMGYFHVMRFPQYPITVMPLTALDRLIPFQPETLIAYFSLWLYIGIAPGLQWGFRELFVYGCWIVALCAAGLGIFYFWPTQVPVTGVYASDFPGYALMQGVDAAGNACPSMHVAAAIFTAIRVHDVLRQAGTPRWLRALNWFWFVAIAYSTLAVKQHVVFDLVAGAALGALFAAASLRWRPGPLPAVGRTFGRADIISPR